MFLQFDGNGALYAQLARALKRAILQGQLKAGAALPATRALAAELGLSRNTVLTAYEMLRAEQLAVARVGSGTFVSASTASGDRPPIKARVPAQTRYAARLRSLPRADASQRRASPALRPALRRAFGRSAAGHRMAARAGTRGERRRLGLPAKRRPACAASGHQRISRAAARRRVPRRRRRRRQRDAAGGLPARPRADRRRGGRRDRRSRLRTRVARVAGAWRAPAAGQGRRRGLAGRGAAAWKQCPYGPGLAVAPVSVRCRDVAGATNGLARLRRRARLLGGRGRLRRRVPL